MPGKNMPMRFHLSRRFQIYVCECRIEPIKAFYLDRFPLLFLFLLSLRRHGI